MTKILNRQLSAYKAFVFDFDGVLADSVEVKTRAFAKLFEKHGPDIVARVMEHHRNNGGMTRVKKFLHYHEKFLKDPLDETSLKDLCSEFSSIVVDQVVAAPEIAGAEEFVKKWHKQVKCFVDSATPDEEIREIVQRRGLNKYFLEVLGSGQSKAENLKHIIDNYSLDPTEVLFWGDAWSDYRAAQICKTDFIAVLPDEKAPLLGKASNMSWIINFNEI